MEEVDWVSLAENVTERDVRGVIHDAYVWNFGKADKKAIAHEVTMYFKAVKDRHPNDIPPWLRLYCRERVSDFDQKNIDHLALFYKKCISWARNLFTLRA